MPAGRSASPMTERPKASPPMPRPDRTKPIKSNWRRPFGLEVGNVAGRHRHADQADRHVDDEDPMPRCIRGDEAAERRTADRPDQRRYGHQRHGVDQKPLVDAAHQDEAADRRHHRAAGALNNARHHELIERARQRAADRAEHEHDDGDAEDIARAEAVGDPAARRNENGEREQIRRDGKFQRQRIGAERLRDGRQRGRDHRRVHVFHEQRDRDDQRDDAIIGDRRRRLRAFAYRLAGPALSRCKPSAGCWNDGSISSALRKSAMAPA